MHEDYAQEAAALAKRNMLLFKVKIDIYNEERMICIKKGAQ